MQHSFENTAPNGALKHQIVTLEARVWQALVDGDKATDDALLAAEFLGVYPDGFAGKAAHVAQLDAGPSLLDFRLSDSHLRLLGPEAVMLVYRGDYLRVGGTLWEAMLVSSVWERRGQSWVNTFSQDTPLSGETVP